MASLLSHEAVNGLQADILALLKICIFSFTRRGERRLSDFLSWDREIHSRSKDAFPRCPCFAKRDSFGGLQTEGGDAMPSLCPVRLFIAVFPLSPSRGFMDQSLRPSVGFVSSVDSLDNIYLRVLCRIAPSPCFYSDIILSSASHPGNHHSQEVSSAPSSPNAPHAFKNEIPPPPTGTMSPPPPPVDKEGRSAQIAVSRHHVARGRGVRAAHAR